MNTPLDISLTQLDSDGVVIIENAILPSELEYLRNKYSSGWNEIINNFTNLQWKKIQFNPNCQINTGFVGKDLYNGHHIAEYKETSILDMSRSRYDFTYGLENIKIQSTIVNYIMQKMLKNEYNSYLGGLPLLPSANANKHNTTERSIGKWHRDAYSLFDNEEIDLTLPPFYYTILIPLFPMQASHGRNTEFIVGSHRINLAQQGITNSDELNHWCHNQKKIKINCKPGDVCIFHGYTIHRGVELDNDTRDIVSGNELLYAVYKKNWYNDEPEDNFI
jgi:hypothetical protein